MNTSVIIVRHAQSKKNIKDVHGGNGESLTPQGIEQSFALVNELSRMGICGDNAVIAYAPNIQTCETAKILSDKLNVPTRNILDFKPLHLGIVHGLSNADVEKKYPDVFNLLSRWRRKEIEICDLIIPDMEDPFDFYDRGIKILEGICEEKHNIFISTNSLYILLLNIMLGNKCSKDGGYKHFDIQNCGISYFEPTKDGVYNLNNHFTNVKDVLNAHTPPLFKLFEN